MRIGIVGYGRFGRAFAGVLREGGAEVRAFDSNGGVEDGVRSDDLGELARWADTIVIATPVLAMRGTLGKMRPDLRREQLVMDVGSVKVTPETALRDVLGREIPWVATHPLFGPTSLALGERPLRVVICPNDVHPDAAKRARALYESIGCDVTEMSAEEHDRRMAASHAVVFFLAKGLLDAGVPTDDPLAPPSFGAVKRMIDAVRSDSGHLLETIETANPFAADWRGRVVESLAAADRALTKRQAEGSDEAGMSIPPAATTKAPDLTEARALIDDVDRSIVELLARRAVLVSRVKAEKANVGAAVRDAAREAALLADRREWATRLGIDPAGVEEIFDAILRMSRRMQRA